MLARLIAQAEAEVRQAKDEYATLLQNNDHPIPAFAGYEGGRRES